MDVYEKQARAEVKAVVQSVYAVEYSDGWAIVVRPFEPDNVGAYKIGFGAAEAAAWIDARNRLTPQQLPARAGAEGDGPRVGGRG